MTQLVIAILLFICFIGILALCFLILAINLYKSVMRESLKYHQAKFAYREREKVK